MAERECMLHLHIAIRTKHWGSRKDHRGYRDIEGAKNSNQNVHYLSTLIVSCHGAVNMDSGVVIKRLHLTKQM